MSLNSPLSTEGTATWPERGGPRRDEIERLKARPLPPGGVELLDRYARESQGRPVIYLSHPITTGRAYVEWLLNSNSGSSRGDSPPREVVDQNLTNAQRARERIAQSLDSHAIVIDPTELDVPKWAQADYHRFWVEVLRRFVTTAVFASDWEYSTGCAIEFAVALEESIPTLNRELDVLSAADGVSLIQEAIEHLGVAGSKVNVQWDILARCREYALVQPKDERLMSAARDYNVASFLSFSPYRARLRYCMLPGEVMAPQRRDLLPAIEELFLSTGSSTVNVRTFGSTSQKGLPFHYGVKSPEAAAEIVRLEASRGLFTIVNETIDVHDGGVSGVSLGGVVEFAPDATPRVVEAEDAASLSAELAHEILSRVYGKGVEIPAREGQRIEFSLHPTRRGARNSHSLVWEREYVGEVDISPRLRWPNRFSRLLGDKTFGLLVADSLGYPVPKTTVVCRRVAPFTFGTATGTGEIWTRTSPMTQRPGIFTTLPKWVDPFALLEAEDPDREIASVLAQDGIDARFSGATIPQSGSTDLIEGVSGDGEAFMLGADSPTELPKAVCSDVEATLNSLRARLGPVRMEWVHDGSTAWIVQLHQAEDITTDAGSLSPGDAETWLPYDPSDGLQALNQLVERALKLGAGVLVTRPVGVTSHVGDVLRKAKIPGRYAPPS